MPHGPGLISYRMMGLEGEWRIHSTNPAARNAEASPVQAKTAGISADLGSTGYPSTTLPPWRERIQLPRAATERSGLFFAGPCERTGTTPTRQGLRQPASGRVIAPGRGSIPVERRRTSQQALHPGNREVPVTRRVHQSLHRGPISGPLVCNKFRAAGSPGHAPAPATAPRSPNKVSKSSQRSGVRGWQRRSSGWARFLGMAAMTSLDSGERRRPFTSFCGDDAVLLAGEPTPPRPVQRVVELGALPARLALFLLGLALFLLGLPLLILHLHARCDGLACLVVTDNPSFLLTQPHVQYFQPQPPLLIQGHAPIARAVRAESP